MQYSPAICKVWACPRLRQFTYVLQTMTTDLTMWTLFWCAPHAIGTCCSYTFHWTIVVSLQSHSPHCVWVHLVALSILQSTTHACVLLNNTWTNLETCHTGGVIRPISRLPDSFLAVAIGGSWVVRLETSKCLWEHTSYQHDDISV